MPQFSETSSQVINTGQPNPGTIPIAPDYVQTLNILQVSVNTAQPLAAVSAPPRDDEVYRPAVISINNLQSAVLDPHFTAANRKPPVSASASQVTTSFYVSQRLSFQASTPIQTIMNKEPIIMTKEKIFPVPQTSAIF